MDRTETEQLGDFADGMLVFPDQLLAFLQLDIEQIALWGIIQMRFE